MRNAVIIIGATGRLGHSFCFKAAAAGYPLFLIARNADALGTLEAKLSNNSNSFIASRPADIGLVHQLQQAFSAANEAGMRVGTVINAAAAAAKFPMVEASDEAIHRVIQTNLVGALNSIKCSVPLLRKNGGGQIIQVISTAGVTPIPNFSVYGMSKAAQLHAAKVAAIELAADNIAVNAFSPGIINNEFLSPWLETDAGKAYKSALPVGAIASVDNVADALLWLVKCDNRLVTGNVIAPDGAFQYFANQSKKVW